MDKDIAERIYEAYLKIFDMRLKVGIRREMLTWALTENPDHWPIVGITHAALDRFAQHEFKCAPKMGIHRSHLVDRKEWQSRMLHQRMPFDEWLSLYLQSDQTVLATSSENMKGTKTTYLPIPTNLGMFKSTVYKWRHTSKERELLRAMHENRTRD